MFSANPYVEPASGTTHFERERFEPIIALHETPTSYEIELDLPETAEDDLDVRVYPTAVVIHCRHAIDRASDERTFGAFVKRVHFTHAIDPRRVSTVLAAGRLNITVNKAAAPSSVSGPLQEERCFTRFHDPAGGYAESRVQLPR
jgi:HSP20 family molecular chaperone IbpA